MAMGRNYMVTMLDQIVMGPDHMQIGHQMVTHRNQMDAGQGLMHTERDQVDMG